MSLRAPTPIRPLLLAIWTLLAGAIPAAAQRTEPPARPAPCADAPECRRLAFEAEAAGDFQRFHDLAWRAVQIGRANDAALMYQLARAQVLSGRPHDALVMVRRLADMGVATDAATSEEFARTRALPEWPDVAARIARVPTPVIISPAGGATAPASAERTARTVAEPSTIAPPPPDAKAAAVTPRAANPPAAPVAIVRPRTPAPAAAAAVAVARPATPFPVRPARSDEAARFSADRFSSGGLAYDTVSRRFIIGDAIGRKLMVVGVGAAEPSDMVREDSAGFQDVAAVEIDDRRGDLWVASTAAGEPGGAVHRLQLVSGRPLRTYRAAPAHGAIRAIDLAITPSGAVLALDAGRTSILAIARGATEMTVAMPLTLERPASVAATADERVIYVAHAGGIARGDLRARTMTPVGSARGFDLTGLERIRMHRGAIIGAQRQPDGLVRIVRLELSSNGRTVTDAAEIASAPLVPGVPPFLTVSNDDLYYLTQAAVPPAGETNAPSAGTPSGGSSRQWLTVLRLRLR